MHRLVGVLVGLLSLAWSCGSPAQSESPAPAKGPLQQTKMAGTAPRLDGRWLMLITVGSGAGGLRRAASIWEVTGKDGALDVTERFVRLPGPMQQALEKSDWHPGPADLDEIARQYDRLEPEARGITSVTTEVFGRDGFDEQLGNDASTKDAFWVVRQVYLFVPGASRPARQVNLYASEADVDGVIRGRYVGLTIAAAPFPIPIKLDGTFELVSLARPPRSLWARIGDFFRGCGG
jgi:hypothetical protein